MSHQDLNFGKTVGAFSITEYRSAKGEWKPHPEFVNDTYYRITSEYLREYTKFNIGCYKDSSPYRNCKYFLDGKKILDKEIVKHKELNKLIKKWQTKYDEICPK
ncbi:hypothetical protein [Marinagarivorans cellulosilyticus]|nr:hypothetical protein [Marinagarivorans cellulosilyticus]